MCVVSSFVEFSFTQSREKIKCSAGAEPPTMTPKKTWHSLAKLTKKKKKFDKQRENKNKTTMSITHKEAVRAWIKQLRQPSSAPPSAPSGPGSAIAVAGWKGGKLWLGDIDDAMDLVRLQAAGVTHIINCAARPPSSDEDDAPHLRLRKLDSPGQGIFLPRPLRCPCCAHLRANLGGVIRPLPTARGKPGGVPGICCHRLAHLPHGRPL
jgi:hypothetical protein